MSYAYRLVQVVFLSTALWHVLASIQCYQGNCKSNCTQEIPVDLPNVTCPSGICGIWAIFNASDGGLLEHIWDCSSTSDVSFVCAETTTVNALAYNRRTMHCSCNSSLCNNITVQLPLTATSMAPSATVTTETLTASSMYWNNGTTAAASGATSANSLVTVTTGTPITLATNMGNRTAGAESGATSATPSANVTNGTPIATALNLANRTAAAESDAPSSALSATVTSGTLTEIATYWSNRTAAVKSDAPSATPSATVTNGTLTETATYWGNQTTAATSVAIRSAALCYGQAAAVSIVPWIFASFTATQSTA